MTTFTPLLQLSELVQAALTQVFDVHVVFQGKRPANAPCLV